MCIICGKTFLLVPQILTLSSCPWLLTHFGQSDNMNEAQRSRRIATWMLKLKLTKKKYK